MMQRKDTCLEAVKKEIATLQAPVRRVTEEEIEASLRGELDHLVDSLLGDPLPVKMELQRRIDSLTLTPVECEGRPAIQVTGDVTLFTGEPSFLLDEHSEVIGTRTLSDNDSAEGVETRLAA